MLRKLLLLCLFVLAIILNSCDVDKTSEPIPPQITYIHLLTSNPDNGNIGNLKLQILYMFNQLGGFRIDFIEKPSTIVDERKIDNQQITRLKSIVDTLKIMFRPENFINDTFYFGYIKNVFSIRKQFSQDSSEVLLVDSLELYLPYIKMTIWRNEANPEEYIEFINDSICKISFQNTTANFSFSRLPTGIKFEKNCPIENITFIAGNIANFYFPAEGKTYYFKKK